MFSISMVERPGRRAPAETPFRVSLSSHRGQTGGCLFRGRFSITLFIGRVLPPQTSAKTCSRLYQSLMVRDPP